jgi:glycosyltransferase involved in cell wall biosynthesis
LICQVNGGVASDRNKGLKYANQNIVGFLDSDDRWLPHMLETLVPIIKNDSELVVLYSNWLVGDEDKRGRFFQLGYMN